MKATVCENPWVPHTAETYFPCGYCLACKKRGRNLWFFRLLLEFMDHDSNCFVTLTYDDQHLPVGGNLNGRHVKNWLKLLRKSVSPEKIRFYLAGEYGDRTFRPHYHAVLFGLSAEQVVYSEHGSNSSLAGFDDGWRIDAPELWHRGSLSVSELNLDRLGYVVGYVTKKMTKSDDPRLRGRIPEFGRMSLRPGLGAKRISRLLPYLLSDDGKSYVAERGDVPGALRIGKEVYPIGRYLKGKVREAVGMEKKTPDSILSRQGEELSELFRKARENPKKAKAKKREIVLDMVSQWCENLRKQEERMKGTKSRRYL